MSEQKKFSIAFHTTVETSLFSNVLKVCVNEIDNTQEKNEKVKEVLKKTI